MGSITLDFDTWDPTKDLLLHRPGSLIGYTAINNGLDVGDTPTVRQRRRDPIIREAEDGVIGLIAGGVEWLRQRGMSAAEVENKVKAYKRGNLDRADQQFYGTKAMREAMESFSNPRNRTLGKDVVIG